MMMMMMMLLIERSKMLLIEAVKDVVDCSGQRLLLIKAVKVLMLLKTED